MGLGKKFRATSAPLQLQTSDSAHLFSKGTEQRASVRSAYKLSNLTQIPQCPKLGLSFRTRVSWLHLKPVVLLIMLN